MKLIHLTEQDAFSSDRGPIAFNVEAITAVIKANSGRAIIQTRGGGGYCVEESYDDVIAMLEKLADPLQVVNITNEQES